MIITVDKNSDDVMPPQKSSWTEKGFLLFASVAFFLYFFFRLGFLSLSSQIFDIVLWHATFAESMANQPFFSFYATHIGYPLPAPAVFGLPLDLCTSLLIRLGIPALAATSVVFMLFFSAAGWGAFAVGRFFHVRPLLALLGCFVWMSFPSLLHNVGYGALGLNLLFLPFYLYWSLLLAYGGGVSAGRKVLLSGCYCFFVIFALFMDGYAFVLFAVMSSSLLGYQLIVRKSLRRILLQWAIPVHLGSFLLAYLLYRAYVGRSSWLEFDLDSFIFGGGELLYYLVPYGGITIFDRLGISRFVTVNFPGEESTRATVFLGHILLPALIAGWLIVKKRKMALFFLLLALGAYYLSLGAYFKLEVQDLSAVESIREYCLAPTGNEFFYRYVPGMKNMRCIYRFAILGQLGLWTILLLLCNRRNKKLEWLGGLFLTVILIINVGPFMSFRMSGRKDFRELDSQILPTARQVFTPDERILVLPVQNDFIIPYLAANLNLRCYNIGGDKNMETAQLGWPGKIAAAADLREIDKLNVLSLLIDAPLDAVVLHYNSMLPEKASSAWMVWPPLNQNRQFCMTLEDELTATQYVDIDRTELFSVVRLKPEFQSAEKRMELKKRLNLYAPEKIEFANSYPGVRVEGLYSPESWGRWSNGEWVTMFFEFPPEWSERGVIMKFSGMAVMIQREVQTAELFVNGRLIGVWTLTAAQPEGIFECRITPDMIEDNQLMLQFKIDNPVSPKQAGLNEDSRLLAVGFRSVDISLMAATQDPNKKTSQTGELSR